MKTAAHRQMLPWSQSTSGRVVTLLDPDPASISIRDIAAQLAKICRFAGATHSFYSVAQHSVLVSKLVDVDGPRAALYGLLHDAHEAYIGDITQPCKTAVRALLAATSPADVVCPIDTIAYRIDVAVHAAIGLPFPPPPRIATAVHLADMRALATEKRDMLADDLDWGDMPPPARGAIKPWPWPKAEAVFLGRFADLATLASLDLDRMIGGHTS